LSALPSKADMCSAVPDVRFGSKADICARKKSCLLYPQKRTFAVRLVMSAKGQKRTSRYSFDHLVSLCEQRWRHGETECLTVVSRLPVPRASVWNITARSS